MEHRVYHPIWDRLGIATAAVCAVHCLLLPLLLPVLAMSGLEELADPRVEQTIVVTTVVLAGIVLWHGYRYHHGRQLPLLIAAMGGVVFAVRHALGTTSEPALLAVGAILIITSHALNLRFHRSTSHAVDAHP